MDAEYLKIIVILLAFTFFVIFFIFTTAVAVYLKIFIQKGLGAKEFILSKNYTGGIPHKQFEWIHYFDILYDFFMLFVLSFASYSTIAGMLLPMLLGFDIKPYWVIGLYLFLVFVWVVIIPIDEIESITKPRWTFPTAPKGIMIVWKKRSKFGYVYNFISKYFIYIFLLLAIFSLIIVFLFINNKNCDSKQLNTDKDCSCSQDAKKESYQVMCFAPPCPTETYYRCRYSECKINTDCPKGQVCGGDGEIGKCRPI